MEKKLYELKIDPELEQFIPALQESEYRALEGSLVSEGCSDPLVTWNGIIVDGHNRYKICREHNIPFEYREVQFKDKNAAKVWMAEHQLGRRNLNTFQKCQIIVPIEESLTESLKEKAEKRRREKISEFQNKGETVGDCPPSRKTRDLVAALADTSARTFKKAKYIIMHANPRLINSVTQGETSIDRAYNQARKNNEGSSEPEETGDDESGFEDSKPVPFIEHPTEDPVTHREPQREQGSYEFVKDQVEFAIRNMIADMKVGIYCLSNEDFGKKKELKAILREGYKQAAAIIDGLEKM